MLEHKQQDVVDLQLGGKRIKIKPAWQTPSAVSFWWLALSSWSKGSSMEMTGKSFTNALYISISSSLRTQGVAERQVSGSYRSASRARTTPW